MTRQRSMPRLLNHKKKKLRPLKTIEGQTKRIKSFASPSHSDGLELKTESPRNLFYQKGFEGSPIFQSIDSD